MMKDNPTYKAYPILYTNRLILRTLQIPDVSDIFVKGAYRDTYNTNNREQ
ncbi:hypothetical protein QUF88_18815 [Bacillus sp. DX1.1]|nr:MULTISPECIES: hypothetical protein [unclassified Bacillus (in: firmicutes)]MDM5155768.1 hypothetical protein [Bacillus sp. DX1.1]WJE80067.1 hypothetical protein QRE67_16345 [Bacillus sp. DX3.1]